MKPVLARDAKASAHSLLRQGIGRLKDKDVAYLWIQDEVEVAQSQEYLGTKAPSKAVIANHSITLGDVNMTEERVENARKAWRCFATLVPV